LLYTSQEERLAGIRQESSFVLEQFYFFEPPFAGNKITHLDDGLKELKVTYGHCKVPTSEECPYHELSVWLQGQKECIRRRVQSFLATLQTNGKKLSSLSDTNDERCKILLDLGVTITITNDEVKKIEFEERLAQLKAFKAQHGRPLQLSHGYARQNGLGKLAEDE
jgi:hypothetical protein